MSKPIVLRLHTHEASTMTHLASPLSIRTDISDGCSFLSSCSTSDPLLVAKESSRERCASERETRKYLLDPGYGSVQLWPLKSSGEMTQQMNDLSPSLSFPVKYAFPMKMNLKYIYIIYMVPEELTWAFSKCWSSPKYCISNLSLC